VSSEPSYPPSGAACSGSLALTLGSTPLTISDGPGDYTRNMNCTWSIAAPSGQRIRIVFNAFNTTEFADHVIVHDGSRVQEHPKRLFGTSIPAPVTSSGPNMLVQFVSDNSHHAHGFVATLSLVAGPVGVGKVPPMAPITNAPQPVPTLTPTTLSPAAPQSFPGGKPGVVGR
jgi:hypothetical protein